MIVLEVGAAEAKGPLLFSVTVGKKLSDGNYAIIAEIPGSRTNKGAIADFWRIFFPYSIFPGEPLGAGLVIDMQGAVK